MSRLSNFLADANILKNFLLSGRTSIVVKGNSQIFSASSNVVKTAPIYQDQNYFKLLNISSCAPFDVCSLLLNHNESLLAVIGETSVAIVDIKDAVDFDSSDPVWDCFDVSITPTKCGDNSHSQKIKSVVWHPASSTMSELVILTETEILLYDIVFSLTQPMASWALSDFPQLEGRNVSSISFGSSKNLAGSITLYLSTECGQIYALFPLSYESAQIRTTKKQLTDFVKDWDSFHQSYVTRLPPSATFKSYRAIFTKHIEFVNELEAELDSSVFTEASSGQMLNIRLKKRLPAVELFGSLAQLGPSLKIIEPSSNDDVSILAAAYKDHQGRVVISYLAQIIPLTLSTEKPYLSDAEPTKPQRKPAQAKEPIYSKPKRGFGFVIDFEDDEHPEEEIFEREMQAYFSDIEAHKMKRKLGGFIDSNVNKLTVMATNSIDLEYSSNTNSSFQALGGAKFFLASESTFVIGDLARSASRVLDPGYSSFEASYKLVDFKSSATDCALVNDTIECSGEYVIACSSASDASVYQVENYMGSRKPSTFNTGGISRIIDTDQQTRQTTLPAEELTLIKADAAKELARVGDLDPSHFESLETVNAVSTEMVKKISSFTKFLLALQAKLSIQHEQLQSQVNDLSQVEKSAKTIEVSSQNIVKIESLSSRQEALIERIDSIRQKVVERFEAARAEQKLPLSTSEKEWFTELNRITKIVTRGNDEAPSMMARVGELRKEVSDLRKKKESQSTEDGLNELLSELSMESNLSKLSMALASEGEFLEQSKLTIDSCLSRLQRSVQA